MHTLSVLKTIAIALALLCAALAPVAMGHDPGLARRAVRMDALPHARWPNLLTRVGIACLLLSFALLLAGCYYMLANARN
ncbi:hypothetical protein B0G71_0762 [Paraburkholderia sp. BL27I4N3]|uniref:hypothetical protein n=1 Tax=Paraburkholderia sp. BL27I4N3 TaxID=1938805 RepID=UPI000E239886|nr:hypothetical protein [Paraburkholderia sp. BL27I4N3]REE17794.1 hypothetical protein B0G71_0762 [Paraburkholderia sp. BL27I4N3]